MTRVTNPLRPSTNQSADDRAQYSAVLDASCGDHCITCSDEGIPMRVEAILGNGLAKCIDAADTRSDVMTALVSDVAIGDTLLVHAGTALLKLSMLPETAQ